MSGMSGGHSGIGDGGVMPFPMQDESSLCAKLVIITNLASVDVDVLSKTQVGDILPLETQSLDGPVVVLRGSVVLGTVLSSHLMQLLNCMNNGTKYEAKILEIEDAICQVKVSAVK